MVAAPLRAAAAGRAAGGAGGTVGTDAPGAVSFLAPLFCTGFTTAAAELDPAGREGSGCRELIAEGRCGVLAFAVREVVTFAAVDLLADGFALPAGTRPQGFCAADFALFEAGPFAPRFAAAAADLGTGFTDFFLGAAAPDFFAVFAADLRTGFAVPRAFVACFALLPEALTVLGVTHRLLAAARQPGTRSYLNVGR